MFQDFRALSVTPTRGVTPMLWIRLGLGLGLPRPRRVSWLRLRPRPSFRTLEFGVPDSLVMYSLSMVWLVFVNVIVASCFTGLV